MSSISRGAGNPLCSEREGLGMEAPDESMEDVPASPGRRSGAPRLFIKEMVMRNFKSYAGEQRVGPFHKVRVSLCSSRSSEKFNFVVM